MPSKEDPENEYKAIRACFVKCLTEGLSISNTPVTGNLSSECVKVTWQKSRTNCGWQIANYAAFFFRENRGKDNWEFKDWTSTVLLRTSPKTLDSEEAAVIIWMFAIRSELNGTGKALREPKNIPVVFLDTFREIKAENGWVSQQEIIKRG